MEKIFKKCFKVVAALLIAMANVGNVALAAAPDADSVKDPQNNLNNISDIRHTGVFLGANAVINRVTFKPGLGTDLFAKHAEGINPFVKFFPHQNFGLEVGFEAYAIKSRKAFVSANSSLAGLLIIPAGNPPIGFFVLGTKIKQWYVPINVIAKIIIKDNYFIELAPGISISKLKVRYTYLADQDDYLSRSDIFSRTKVIPIFKMAFGYRFNNYFSVNGLIGWKQSSKLSSMITSNKYNGTKAIINSKNSFNYGIGMSYFFI